MMPSVLPDQIIRECLRRIEARYPHTVQTVLVGDGGEPATAMMLEIERLRACQDHLLAMTPLPGNFRSDHVWQGYPPGFRFQTVVSQVAAPAPVAAPVAAPVQPAQAPNIIVVPSGNQQIVYGGPHPGYAPVPPDQFPSPVAGIPNVPYGTPMPAPVQPADVPQAMPPDSVSVARPVVPTTTVTDPVAVTSRPPPEVWSSGKEALFLASVRAVNGDHASAELLTEFASEVGLDVSTFCQRVISERARTLEIWKTMQGDQRNV